MADVAANIKERVSNLYSLIRSSDIENLPVIFRTLSNEYETRILRPNESVENIQTLLTHWFASFLSYRDEVFVLIQGAVHRAHHINNKFLSKSKQSRDRATSSGTEARFYHRIPYKYLSGCSVDGIRFDTYEMKSSKVSIQLDLVDGYKSTIDEAAKELIIIFESAMKSIAKTLGWKLILFSESLSNYCGEVITFEIPPTSAPAISSSSMSGPSKFTLDRKASSVQRVLSKQTTTQLALARVIFEVESTATAPSKKPAVQQSRPATVLEDEEEAEEALRRKRRREEELRAEQEKAKVDFAMTSEQKIDDLKREHQASLGLLSDATIDLARRELAAGNCNYRPDAPAGGYESDDEVEDEDGGMDRGVESSNPPTGTQTPLLLSQNPLHSQSQSQSVLAQSQGVATQHVVKSLLLAPAKQTLSNSDTMGTPETATMTIRLLIKTQPAYLLRCKNRSAQQTTPTLPSAIDVDFQWCTLGDEKLKSATLRVPVRTVLQYARTELMKLTVFRQSPHFAPLASSDSSSSSSSSSAIPCPCASCHAFAVPIAIRRFKSDQLLLVGDSLVLPPLLQERKVRAFELVCAQESPLTPAYSFLHQITSRASLLALQTHDRWLNQQVCSNFDANDENSQIAMMESTAEEISQQLDLCYKAYNQILLPHIQRQSSAVNKSDIPVACVYEIAQFFTLKGIITTTPLTDSCASAPTASELAATLQAAGVAAQLSECVALIACAASDSSQAVDLTTASTTTTQVTQSTFSTQDRMSTR